MIGILVSLFEFCSFIFLLILSIIFIESIAHGLLIIFFCNFSNSSFAIFSFKLNFSLKTLRICCFSFLSLSLCSTFKVFSRISFHGVCDIGQYQLKVSKNFFFKIGFFSINFLAFSVSLGVRVFAFLRKEVVSLELKSSVKSTIFSTIDHSHFFSSSFFAICLFLSSELCSQSFHS